MTLRSRRRTTAGIQRASTARSVRSSTTVRLRTTGHRIGMGQLLPSHYLSLIRSLVAASLTPEQQFEHAFMVVAGRQPDKAERAQTEAIWQAADGVAVTALERIFWSLLNTRGRNPAEIMGRRSRTGTHLGRTSGKPDRGQSVAVSDGVSASSCRRRYLLTSSR